MFDVSSRKWQCTAASAEESAAGGCCGGQAAGPAGAGGGGDAQPTGRSVFGAGVHSCGQAHAAGGMCDHHGHIVTFGGEVDPSTQGHAGEGTACLPLAIPCFVCVFSRLITRRRQQAGVLLPCPTNVRHHACRPAGAGGFSSELWCLDTASLRWHKLAAEGPAPCARGWFGSCLVDGALVVHGGVDVDNRRLDDLYTLTL